MRLLVILCCLLPLTLRAAPKPLRIYFIDTEGGQSTLIVDSQGESLLIDTGYAGFDGRDPDRIMKAVHSAGISQLDGVLLTHYHSDHAGGVAGLAKRIRIKEFYDHGPNVEQDPGTERRYDTFLRVSAGRRTTVRSGEVIPYRGMRILVLSAAGRTIRSPLPGAGQPNRLCASAVRPGIDKSENAQSVGVLVTYGKFRFIDLGDLTARGELALVCPDNLIGSVDLMITTHHGTYHVGPDSSNTPALVHALQPRAAVMNNGTHKGGSRQAFDVYRSSPGFINMWQLHYAFDAGPRENSPSSYIANIGAEKGCHGYPIEAVAERSGSFTVMNMRNQFRKTYRAR